jgi:hypothetical protein
MKWRVAAAVVLLFLFVLGSHAFLLSARVPWQEAMTGENDADAYARRMEAVRAELPARGEVGYRAVPVNPDKTEAARHFYLTQYSLVPLRLDYSGETVPAVIDGESDASVSREREVP